MKALIISDIHSNYSALQAILAVEHDCDFIYCAGDLVDFGPQPHQVVHWFHTHDVTSVQGNHDRSVTRIYRELFTYQKDIPSEEVSWGIHNARLVNAADIDYLDALPETENFVLDGYEYLIQHRYGQGYETIESLSAFNAFFSEKSWLKTTLPRRIIFGHTHRQCIHVLADDALWLNPGSISYRHGGDPEHDAHYITITNGHIHLKRIPYEVSALFEAINTTTLKPSAIKKAYEFWPC